MQNKVVQAMACELPVVATSEANEGIGAKPNDEIELQDSPEDFAAALVRLLRDAKERERLGRAGRRFVEANWTWDAHFEKFEKILRSVARA
jgi:glycosyltransferase involved in cell wall biosynthesis